MMQRRRLLSRTEIKWRLPSLQVSIGRVLGEIRLSRNRRETLETSRETKISRIMREGSKKKKSIIG